jgi:DUF1016 N-terminal domain
MSESLVKTNAYKTFIQEIKQRIQSAQIKAAVSVNQELLRLYWDLAERIVTKQQEAAWGDRFFGTDESRFEDRIPRDEGVF